MSIELSPGLQTLKGGSLGLTYLLSFVNRMVTTTPSSPVYRMAIIGIDKPP